MHEFVFYKTHVIVKRVSNIGQGRKITLNPDYLKYDSKYDFKIVNHHQLDERGKPMKYTLNPMPGAVELQEDVAEPSSDQIVFDCKMNPDCQAEFSSIDELKIHQDGGCFRKEP